MDIDRILTNLKRRRYEAHYFNTKEEAMDYLAAELKGRTIGLGDSATLAAMGAYDRLSQENDVVDPVHPLPGEKFRDVAKRKYPDNPCARAPEMKCYDCSATDRICNAMTIHFKKMRNTKAMEVLIIGEELGF